MKASPTLSISLFIVKFLSIVKNTAQIGCKMHLSLSTTIEVMNVCYFCYLSGILVLTQLGSISATTLARLLLRSQQRCKEVSSATRSGEMQGEGMPRQ